MKNVVFFMIKSAENSDSQSYDRHEESRNFWRCNFTKACCDFTKTRKSPVYKVVRAILLSKVIYIFLPSLSIRALFKKPDQHRYSWFCGTTVMRSFGMK